ncbi:MAG: helix-turn-helix domain-containing protein [Bacteroidota bacterium]
MSATEFDPARFARAVRQRLREKKMTQAALAEAVGVTAPTVSGWLSEKYTPTADNVERALGILDLDPDEVVVDPSARRPVTHQVQERSVPVVYIPHDGEAAAGTGRVNGHEESDPHPYPEHVVQQLTGFAPIDELRSFTVVGDSLAPEVMPNTPAIYRRMRQFMGDGLYVLRIDDTEVVKRVQRIPGGALVLSGYNPDYEPVRLLPMPESDTPGTFREERTGLVTYVQVIGKVMLYPKPA